MGSESGGGGRLINNRSLMSPMASGVNVPEDKYRGIFGHNDWLSRREAKDAKEKADGTMDVQENPEERAAENLGSGSVDQTALLEQGLRV